MAYEKKAGVFPMIDSAVWMLTRGLRLEEPWEHDR